MKSSTFGLDLRNVSNLHFRDEKTDLKESMYGKLESSKVMLTSLQTNYHTQLFDDNIVTGERYIFEVISSQAIQELCGRTSVTSKVG